MEVAESVKILIRNLDKNINMAIRDHIDKDIFENIDIDLFVKILTLIREFCKISILPQIKHLPEA